DWMKWRRRAQQRKGRQSFDRYRDEVQETLRSKAARMAWTVGCGHRWRTALAEQSLATVAHSLLLAQNPADGKYWADSENGGGVEPLRIACDGKTNPRGVLMNGDKSSDE